MANDPFAPPVTAEKVRSNSTAIIIIAVLGALLLMALVCGGILLALLLPAVSAARGAARQQMAANHMKMIGLGIHNDHASFQQLPAAAAVDSSGGPLWSWRVALLPFLEESATWDRWQQDQRWDSEANRALWVPMPANYIPVDTSNPAADQTHVFAIRHPLSLMSGEPNLAFKDCSDGLSNTILAVYLTSRTTSWAAPEDLSLQELQGEFANLSPPQAIVVLFGDGSVRRFSSPLDPATIEAMVTRNAGDIVPAL
jgi:hypothetical protein